MLDSEDIKEIELVTPSLYMQNVSALRISRHPLYSADDSADPEVLHLCQQAGQDSQCPFCQDIIQAL